MIFDVKQLDKVMVARTSAVVLGKLLDGLKLDKLYCREVVIRLFFKGHGQRLNPLTK